jgi:hypothetical protein
VIVGLTCGDERDLGLSTDTRAFAQLREDGIVVFVSGRGTFSAPAGVIAKVRRDRKSNPPTPAVVTTSSFTRQARRDGRPCRDLVVRC